MQLLATERLNDSIDD